MPEQLAYNQRDAARLCGVSVSTFQRHVRPELPPPKFVGGRVLFLRRDLVKWLERS